MVATRGIGTTLCSESLRMMARERERELLPVSGMAAVVIAVVLDVELALGRDYGCDCGCDFGRGYYCDNVGLGTGTGAVVVVRRRSWPFRRLDPGFQS
jgi:hypothetical protein